MGIGTSLHERHRDATEFAQTHIKNDRLAGAHKCSPIHRVLAIPAMAGDEDERLVHPAQGRWDQRHGERREPGRDAGNDANRNACGSGRQRTAAPKDARIAAPQAQHAMMGTSKRNKPVGDVGLRWRRPTAALAGKFEHGALRGERPNALTYQRIMHDDIGLGETR